MKLTILGSNAAAPAYGRRPTAQVLNISEQLFLIDCAEGTQMRMQEYGIKRGRINHIFISHMHGDHYFGLIGLLNTMGLLGRQAAINIYGPAQLKEIIGIQISHSLGFELVFNDISEGEEKVILDTNNVQVKCFPVHHSVPTHGFLFKKKERPRVLLPEKLKEFEIPKYFYKQLTDGADYEPENGTWVKNELVTEGGKKQRTYAYTADTAPHECYKEIIKGVDLLYHEATYTKHFSDKAIERLHSTTVEAARIALDAKVGQLIIGHFSSRYKELHEFELEAQAIFPNTELALEGKTFEIKEG